MQQTVNPIQTDQVIQMVRAYRNSEMVEQRLTIATGIVCEVSPALEAFVINQKVGDASADILQMSLISIIKCLSVFRGDSEDCFWGWCYQIVRHKIASHLAKKQRLNETYDPAELEKAAEAASEDVKVPIGAALDHEFFLKILRKSTGQCLELLTKRFVEYWDFKSIAEEFGLPSADAARMRVVRCRDDARAILENYV